MDIIKDTKSAAEERRQIIYRRLMMIAPSVNCPQGRKVQQFCVNQQCQRSMRCGQPKCNSCGPKVHDSCFSMPLEQVTKLFNLKVEKWTDTLTKIFAKEDQIIEKIREGQEQFIGKYFEHQLLESGLTVVKRIFKNRDFETLSGQKALDMMKELQRRLRINQDQANERREAYLVNLMPHVQQIVSLRQKTFLAAPHLSQNSINPSSIKVSEDNLIKKVNPDQGQGMKDEDIKAPVLQLQLNNLNYMKQEQIGYLYFRNSRYVSAIQIFQQIILQYKQQYQQIDGFGSQAEIKDLVNKSLEEWYMENKIKGLIKGSPYEALNLCYYSLQAVEEGIEWYKNILESRPDDYRLTYCLGILQSYRFNFPESIRYFKKTIQLNPNFKKAYLLIAWYYSSEDIHMKQLSKEWLKQAKELYREESNIFLDIMLAENETQRQLQVGKFKEALEKYKESNVRVNRYVFCCYRSQVYALQGEKILRQRINLYPDVWFLYHSLGLVMSYSKIYSDEQIEKQYMKAIDLNPKSYDSYNNLSTLQSKTTIQKLQYCQKAQLINPFMQASYINSSIHYSQLKQFDKALEQLEMCMKINREFSRTYYDLGSLYYNHFPSQVNKAIYYFKEHITMVELKDSYSYFSILNLGNIYYKSKQFTTAIEYYQQGKALNPSQWNCWYRLGFSYNSLRKNQDAQKHFLKAYELNPTASIKKQIANFYGRIGKIAQSIRWIQ